MGKTTKDTNARVARRRKQIKESATEQVCMVNCAWIILQCVSKNTTICRYRIHRSLCQHPYYYCQVPKFLLNLSFLLPRFFFPPYTIAIASSAWWTFTSSLILFSLIVHCFRFSNWSMFLMWSIVTYNLIELHLIPKMLGSQNNKADQLSSQFVTSIQVIPVKIVSVDCIRAIGLSIM